MTSIIHLNKDFIESPFNFLFNKALDRAEIYTFAERIEFIDNFTRGIEAFYSEAENRNNNFLAFTGFNIVASTAAYFTLAIIPPPFNVLLVGGCWASAITSAASGGTRWQTMIPIQEELQKYKSLLISEPALEWAALWQYIINTNPSKDHTKIFLDILSKASEERRMGYQTALRSVANRQGKSEKDVTEFVIAIRNQYVDSLDKPILPTPVVRELPPAIGTNTQLNAIEVSAQQVQDYSPTSNIQRQNAIASLQQTYNKPAEIGLPQELREVMVDSPYSTFVIGMSGAGKDILVYNVVSEIRKKYPQAFIIGIDGKNAPSERNLWAKPNYDHTIHFSMGDSPEDYHEDLLSIFDQVDSYPPFTFIVFSELNGVRDSYLSNNMKDEWQQIANKIRYIALQLNYAQKYFIATAQTANKEELGIGAGRQNAQFCMVSNGQQQSFINAVSRAAVFEGNGVKDTATWQSAISRSPAVSHLPNANQLGGIAYFHSGIGRWMPMPRLHNAGQDRGFVTPVSEVVQPMNNLNQTVEAQAQAQQVAVLEKPAQLEIKSLFQELSDEFKDSDPSMSDFINWLETKQGTVINLRTTVLFWGNKKNRGKTKKEDVAPYLQEAEDLGLLIKTEDGLRVINA
jgi:hypothetical protein